MKKWYRKDDRIAKKMDELLRMFYEEFGWTTRLVASLVGSYIYASLKKEERRLANGWTYEPASFYEKNAAARALEEIKSGRVKAIAPAAPWTSGESRVATG
jgi:hypothetical protein